MSESWQQTPQQQHEDKFLEILKHPFRKEKKPGYAPLVVNPDDNVYNEGEFELKEGSTNLKFKLKKKGLKHASYFEFKADEVCNEKFIRIFQKDEIGEMQLNTVTLEYEDHVIDIRNKANGEILQFHPSPYLYGYPFRYTHKGKILFLYAWKTRVGKGLRYIITEKVLIPECMMFEVSNYVGQYVKKEEDRKNYYDLFINVNSVPMPMYVDPLNDNQLVPQLTFVDYGKFNNLNEESKHALSFSGNGEKQSFSTVDPVTGTKYNIYVKFVNMHTEDNTFYMELNMTTASSESATNISKMLHSILDYCGKDMVVCTRQDNQKDLKIHDVNGSDIILHFSKKE